MHRLRTLCVRFWAILPFPVFYLWGTSVEAISISAPVYEWIVSGCKITKDKHVTCQRGDKGITRIVGLADVESFVSSDKHACAVTTTGDVKCWGANRQGELGDGSTTMTAYAVSVRGLDRVVALTVGSDHSCALLPAGSVKCWGDNRQGKLGSGNTTPSSSSLPLDVSLKGRATAIAAGATHRCALLKSKMVQCWGSNARGQLGHGAQPYVGEPEEIGAPILVPGLHGIRLIAAGGNHTCAVSANAKVQCWGDDWQGRRGDSKELNDYYDKRTVTKPTPVVGLVAVRAVVVGVNDTCALTADGVVKCWGYDIGALSAEPESEWRKGHSVPTRVNGLPVGIKSIAKQGDWMCATNSTNTTMCWGYDNAAGKFEASPIPQH